MADALVNVNCESSSTLSALIMCGGRGSRLGPLGDVVGKSLLPFRGEPLVVGVVRLLKETLGCDHFVFLTGHLGWQVEHVVKSYFPSAGVEFRQDHEFSGTAVSAWSAVSSLGLQRFAYVHGNIALGATAVSRFRTAVEQIPNDASLVTVSRCEFAPTHPRVPIVDGVVGPNDTPSIERFPFSVGLSLLPDLTDAFRQHRPVRGLAFEDFLFSLPGFKRTVHLVDIGGDWYHLEDLAFYHD